MFEKVLLLKLGLILNHLLSVITIYSFYPKNVKTAELIRPKVSVGPYMTPNLQITCPKFQNFCP